MILITSGVPENLLNADATAAPFTSEAMALPVAATYGTWVTNYSVAPGAISIVLEASFDGTIWFTIDTSTNVNGEMRNFQTSATQIRARVASETGGGTITVTVTMKKAFVLVAGTTIGTATLTGGLNVATGISIGGNPITNQAITFPNAQRIQDGGGSSIQIVGTLKTVDGTAALPAYSFTNFTNYGLWVQAGGINTSIGGVTRSQISTAGQTLFIGQNLNPDGSVGAPAYSFTSEPGLGFYRAGVGTMAAAGGVNFNSIKLGGTNSILGSPAVGQVNIANNTNLIGSNIKVDALPTIASGFGTGAAIVAGSTPFAGAVNVGTGGTAFNGVINFNGTAFPSVPFVAISWRTSSITAMRALPTTTQLTVNNVGSAAWADNDIVSWICVGAK